MVPSNSPSFHKYKNDEKYTFIPVSTLYAKYPLEKENVKVIEQSKVEQGECKYGDIKNNYIYIKMH